MALKLKQNNSYEALKLIMSIVHVDVAPHPEPLSTGAKPQLLCFDDVQYLDKQQFG